MKPERVFLAVAAIALTIAPAGLARASESARDAERRLAYMQNRDRTAFGRPALSYSSFLSSLARRHAQNMARAHAIWHDPALPSDVGSWEHVGDNVGRSDSVEHLHGGFMASRQHRDNLLFWAYEQYGVGVAISDDGRIYAAVVFFTPHRVAGGSRSAGTSGGTQRRTPEIQPQTIDILVELVALDAGLA